MLLENVAQVLVWGHDYQQLNLARERLVVPAGLAIMDQFRTGSVCLAIKLMLLNMVDAMGKILYLCQVQGTYRSGANRVLRESMPADGSRSWANKNG